MGIAPSGGLEDFVKVIIDGYKKYGDDFEVKIRELVDSQDSHREKIQSKILEETATMYRVSVRDILKSKKRGRVNLARVSVIILCHKHLSKKQQEIADMFGRDNSLVSRKIKAFKSGTDSPEKFCADKIFQKKFRFLDMRISNFKNSLLNTSLNG